MKVITVTDAWHPQVNGVVRTIEATNRELERAGHTTEVITPLSFSSVPCPGYRGDPPVAVARPSPGGAARPGACRRGDAAIHIATEGPLGQAARRYCLRTQASVHDGLPHALSAVPQRDVRHSRALDLSLPAPLPRPGRDRDGAHTDGRTRTAKQRARQRCAVDTRRRPRCLHATRATVRGPAGVRSSCTSVGSRSKRTSRRFSRSTCRAPRSWPGSGRHSRHCTRRFPGGALRRRARPRSVCAALQRRGRLRVPQPHRHLRAGHARSAGLRHAGGGVSRCRDRSTSSAVLRSRCSTRTCARRRCMHCASIEASAATMPSATPGARRRRSSSRCRAARAEDDDDGVASRHG